MKVSTVTSFLFITIGFIFMNCESAYSQQIESEYTSLLRVKRDGKYGFVNEHGEEVIQCEYDLASTYSDGWVAMQKGGKWAYYDTRGQKKLNLGRQYTYCGDFHDGLAFVTKAPIKSDKFGYVSFWDGLCDDILFINRKGEVVIEVENEWGLQCADLAKGSYADGLLKVVKKTEGGKLIGFLNKKGKMQIPLKKRYGINRTAQYSDGLLVAGMQYRDSVTNKRKIKYGYLNTSGDWHIKPQYAKVLPYEHGVAVVWKENPLAPTTYYTYLIDKDGERVLDKELETNETLVRDSLVAIMRRARNDKGIPISGPHGKYTQFALAKIDGTFVTDFVFADLHPGQSANDPWAATTLDNEDYGFITQDGVAIIPYQYSSIWNSFENGLAAVRMKGYGDATIVIDTAGNVILPMKANHSDNIIGGVISRTNLSDLTTEYYNRHGELIDLSAYQVAGTFQYLEVRK